MPEPHDTPHDQARVDRRALIAVAAQFFINGTVFSSVVPRFPEIRDRLDVSIGTIGLVLTVAGGFGLIGSRIVSPLIERFGTYRVLIAGAVVQIGQLAAIGFVDQVWWLVMVLCVGSASDVLVDVAMNLQGSWLSARRRVPVMNRLHALWSLGSVVGGVVAARLAGAEVPLRWHLLGAATVLAVVLAWIGQGLLRHDENPPSVADTSNITANNITANNITASSNITESGDRPARTYPWLLVTLGVAAMCAFALESTSSDWAAFRMSDDLGANAGRAAFGFVAYTAGMTIGRMLGDTVMARIGRTRTTSIAIALTIAGLGLAALVPTDTAGAQVWVLAGYVLAGLGIATYFPMLYNDAAQAPGKRGAGLGALTAGSRIASLTLPVAVGALAATSLSVGTTVALVTLPAAVGIGAALAAMRRQLALAR